jgi:arginase family enzyme
MGVGTPATGGLTCREARLLMETIAKQRCMSSLAPAEIDPILDHKKRQRRLRHPTGRLQAWG